STHHNAAKHRDVSPADQDARLQLRLGPRSRYNRSRLFQVDAVDLPAAFRHLVRPRTEARATDRRIADSGRGQGTWRGYGSAVPGPKAAGVSGRGAGELVPGAWHRPGERGGGRRQV